MVFVMRFSPYNIAGSRFGLLVALVYAVVLLAATACGEDDPAAGLDFESYINDVETSEPGAVADDTPSAYARLDGDHERLLRIAYVHDLKTLVEEVTAANRDVERLTDDARGAETSLPWVIQVHDMHRASMELRIRAYAYELLDPLVLDYVDFHAAFLEGVQVYSQAADRALQAAIILGPDGRTVGEMTPEQEADFLSLVGEAQFFFRDAQVLLTRSGEDLSTLVSDLYLK